MSWKLKRKEILSSKLDSIFNNNSFVVIVRIGSLSVVDMDSVRCSLGALRALYIKNSIFKRYTGSLEDHKSMGLLAGGSTMLFYGPNGLEGLSALGTFIKSNPDVVVLGAKLDNIVVTPNQLVLLHKQFQLGGNFNMSVLRSIKKPLHNLNLKASLYHFIKVLDCIPHRG